MASYQLSEKNQILVALFAVVVVCAGKLFKDYLFRRGYVEGMTVTTTTNKQLRRNAATHVVAELYLDSTLRQDLNTSHNIELSWTGDVANNVTTGTNFGPDGDYTASVVSGTTDATLSPPSSPSVNGSPIRFTPSRTIIAGSIIRITVKNVTIYSTPNVDKTLTFTVTPSNGESAVSREFKILPALSANQNQFVSSSSATTEEIQAAINDINTRLSTGGITMPVPNEPTY